MHILTGLHDARVTPAHVLYDEWKRALEGWNGPLNVDKPNEGIHFGISPNMGIGVVDNLDNSDNDRSAIGFGYMSGRYLYPWLVIAANGEFKFSHKRWGWQQRDVLAKNTFLTWTHVVHEYCWRVGETVGSYAPPRWNDPIHYVGEKTLGLTGSVQSAWLRTERIGSEWAITFSRNGSRPFTPVTKEDFEKFDRLRERRYRSWERAHLIATGAINPAKPRSRLTPEEQQERFDKTAATLAGFMTVTTRPTHFKKESA